MKLNDRLQKLRDDKKLLVEAIKQAEAKASTVQRKRETRAKIICGGVLLGLAESEREALLSMLLPHMTERDRAFVTAFLAGDRPSKPDDPLLN